MKGQIVVDVELVNAGETDETYRFTLQHPAGTTLEQVASVLSIVTRNLRRRAEEQAAEELAQ